MIAVFSVIYDRFKEKIAKKMRKKSPGLSREILIKVYSFTYFSFQISSLYWAMVRSDEKNPAWAIFTSAFLFHAF